MTRKTKIGVVVFAAVVIIKLINMFPEGEWSLYARFAVVVAASLGATLAALSGTKEKDDEEDQEK